MRSLKILLMASLLSFSPLSIAADLSDAQVTKWLTAATALQAWCSQHQKKDVVPMGPDAIALENPAKAYSHGINEARKTPYFSDIQKILMQNGYENPDEWGQLGDRIITAHVANRMAGQELSPAKIKQAAAHMQQVQDNPNIPPQLRAQMAQAMKGSQAMMHSAQQVPAADKATVSRNASALEKYFKGQ